MNWRWTSDKRVKSKIDRSIQLNSCSSHLTTMIISWKTSVSTRRMIINNFKIISIRLIDIGTHGQKSVSLEQCSIEARGERRRKEMTFPFLRSSNSRWISSSSSSFLYKYWTRRRVILEHNLIVTKRIQWSSWCLTWVAQLDSRAHTCSLIVDLIYMSEVMMRSLDTHTHEKDNIRLTLNEVPAPFRQLSPIKISGK